MSSEYLKKPVNVKLSDRLRHRLLPTLDKVSAGLLTPLFPKKLSDGDFTFIHQAPGVVEAIDRSILEFGVTDKPLDIIFLTMIGGHPYLFATEALLASVLKARGHKVRLVVCDQHLPACESKKNRNRERWDSICGRCWSLGRHLSLSFGHDVIPLSEAQSLSRPTITDEVLNSIHEASLLKYFMVGRLDEAANTKERETAYRESAKISWQLGNYVVDQNPDRVVMSHGMYSTWGPARETINAANIPVITYGKGKRRCTIKFNWKTSADWWDVSEEWQRVKQLELSSSEQKEIDDYLLSRRTHSGDSLVYNFGEEKSKQETIKNLGLDPHKQIFTAFTNVLWDAASAQREIAFDNPIQWIFETIKWFSENPEKQLIVKIHPAEVVIGTEQPFADLISKQFPEVPDNIRIIEPHEKTNSWSIAKITDLGLVHTSTVGMELPLEGIPTAVVSKTHFRGRGFTIDVQTREEYFRLIKTFDAENYDQKKISILAERYAYLLFDRYQIPFEMFDEPNHAQVKSFDLKRIQNIKDEEFTTIFIEGLERGSGSFLRKPKGERISEKGETTT